MFAREDGQFGQRELRTTTAVSDEIPLARDNARKTEERERERDREAEYGQKERTPHSPFLLKGRDGTSGEGTTNLHSVDEDGDRDELVRRDFLVDSVRECV